MDEAARDQITLAYLKQRDNYARVADIVRALIENDQTIPEGTIYTIRARPKKEARLLEKIDQHNEEHSAEAERITVDNFASHIDDLVGVRVVCLIPAAVAKVDALIRSLVDEGRLRFVRDPIQKKTFDIPLDPKDRGDAGVDLQYTGYASNHYVVEIGSATSAPAILKGLRVEIQVRTIFEEAWGELDHPRYELSRSGVKLPESVRQGFYILGAQLAVNSINAQYLTDELRRLSTTAEAQRVEQSADSSSSPKLPLAEVVVPLVDSVDIDAAIGRRFGFVGNERTRTYARRRFAEHAYINKRASTVAEVERILAVDVLQLYADTFRGVIGREPFKTPETRDQDMIVAINFALFYDVQPATATEGLSAILQDRLRRESRAGLSDTTPPELLEFSIVPERLRVTEADGSVTIAAQLRDELSGVAGAGYTSSPSQARFRSPSGAQFITAVFTAHGNLIAGTANDGTFSDTVRVPRYSETGRWSLEYFLLVDQVGNSAQLKAADLETRGMPTSFEVLG